MGQPCVANAKNYVFGSSKNTRHFLAALVRPDWGTPWGARFRITDTLRRSPGRALGPIWGPGGAGNQWQTRKVMIPGGCCGSYPSVLGSFGDPFWMISGGCCGSYPSVFGSFWDPFLDDSWRLLRFISIGSGIVLGSFLDALWRLLRFISIDSGIVLG